jgi:uncharacterized protein YndB with AHSA1/START domain
MPDMNGLVAKAEITVDAPVARVWDALTDPARIKRYYFGSEVATDWEVGSAITWSGTWEGKPYQDKGVVLKNVEHRLLEYSHFSPMMGRPDVPENYHTVRVELEPTKGGTRVTLAQDNNVTEQARTHSESNWNQMLVALKSEAES